MKKEEDIFKDEESTNIAYIRAYIQSKLGEVEGTALMEEVASLLNRRLDYVEFTSLPGKYSNGKAELLIEDVRKKTGIFGHIN